MEVPVQHVRCIGVPGLLRANDGGDEDVLLGDRVEHLGAEAGSERSRDVSEEMMRGIEVAQPSLL